MIRRKLVHSLLAIFTACTARAFAAADLIPDDQLFPFVMPLEKSTGAIDASHWLDAPAGASGFVKAEDGHFAINGKRIRFWGTNVAFGGAFPTKEEAPLVAAKLARFGINIVRIHSADIIDGRPSLIDRSVKDTQHLSADHLDRLDFFINELAKRGVYTNINLHVNRTFTAEDGVSAADQLPMFSKNITLFDRCMIDLQKKYATDVLTHVNPYRKLSYAQDPAVAFVEVTNENSFFYGWYSKKLDSLPAPYAKQLDAKFNEWLSKHYQSTEQLVAAWKQQLPATERLEDGTVSRPAYKDPSRSDACYHDYLEFLWELERDYFREMRDHLKKEIKVAMPVTGTMYFTMAGGMIQSDTMDFVDMHAYWQHPEFSTEWKGKWTIKNTPMIDQPERNTLSWLGAARVEGKPFTVSEYNAPWPNFYDAEAIPLIAAYGARQNWDAIYLFNYNGNGEFRRDKVYSFFDIDGHPVKTAQMIAGAALFTRGDVPPAEQTATATISRDTALQSAIHFGWNKGEEALDALMESPLPTNTVDRAWGLHFQPETRTPLSDFVIPPSQPSVTPFVWRQGSATIDTPRSKMLAGHATKEPTQLGSVTIQLHEAPGDFGVITMQSMDDAPSIESSRQILIIAAGRTQNTAMKWSDDNTSAYDGMGTAPVLTQGLGATITINAKDPMTGYALDAAGMEKTPLPISRSDGSLTIELKRDYETIWYVLKR